MENPSWNWDGEEYIREEWQNGLVVVLIGKLRKVVRFQCGSIKYLSGNQNIFKLRETWISKITFLATGFTWFYLTLKIKLHRARIRIKHRLRAESQSFCSVFRKTHPGNWRHVFLFSLPAWWDHHSGQDASKTLLCRFSFLCCTYLGSFEKRSSSFQATLQKGLILEQVCCEMYNVVLYEGERLK